MNEIVELVAMLEGFLPTWLLAIIKIAAPFILWFAKKQLVKQKDKELEETLDVVEKENRITIPRKNAFKKRTRK